MFHTITLCVVPSSASHRVILQSNTLCNRTASVALLYACLLLLLQQLATNMTPWQAPPNAALSMGANSTRYVALELHYNNPERLTGQRDTGSGIRCGSIGSANIL